MDAKGYELHDLASEIEMADDDESDYDDESDDGKAGRTLRARPAKKVRKLRTSGAVNARWLSAGGPKKSRGRGLGMIRYRPRKLSAWKPKGRGLRARTGPSPRMAATGAIVRHRTYACIHYGYC